MVCFVHNWNGCTCIKCGKNRHENHQWDGSVCSICGFMRDEQHSLINGKCKAYGKEQAKHVLRVKFDCPGCGRKKQADMEYPGPGKPLEVRVNCFNCGFAGKLEVVDSSFKGECQCQRCGEIIHLLDNQCKCKLCWEVIHDTVGCRCRQCNEVVHNYHEGICKTCGHIAKINIAIDLNCRKCGEQLSNLIIVDKWGAYEKVMCPNPECGELYRYRGFNKNSEHEWLIISDDNNATIYKCIRCGAWYETNWGDVVYESPEAPFNCIK